MNLTRDQGAAGGWNFIVEFDAKSRNHEIEKVFFGRWNVRTKLMRNQGVAGNVNASLVTLIIKIYTIRATQSCRYYCQKESSIIWSTGCDLYLGWITGELSYAISLNRMFLAINRCRFLKLFLKIRRLHNRLVALQHVLVNKSFWRNVQINKLYYYRRRDMTIYSFK
jgi:hypothetical protein